MVALLNTFSASVSEAQSASTLQVIADRSVLWPPNHRYEDVELSISGTREESLSLEASVESDEPDDAPGNGDGATTGDIRVTTAKGEVLHSSNRHPKVSLNPLRDRLELRAERDARGSGRVYLVTVRATNSTGTVQTETVQVEVPRSPVDDLTAAPAPWRPGPFEVCTFDYNFSPNREQFGIGRIYAPVVDARTCTTSGPFNLVLISHADFSPGMATLFEAHLEYEELARHLATNALMVVSINRYALGEIAGAIEYFDDVLEGHLDYLYNESPIKSFITDRVGLIGHSAGGRSVLRHADVVNTSGRDLESLIVIAPTIDAQVDKTFEGVTDSFLGLHAANDSDPGAFGGKQPGEVMTSTFKIYDDAGLTPNPNELSVTKDMVFLEGGGHFIQNTSESLTYINAFLQTHLNGHSIFQRFLKLQERPAPMTSFVVWQQHADPERLVVADFENGSAGVNTLNGAIDFSTDGIEGELVGSAHQIDDFSPHHTTVLKFHLDPTPGMGNPNFVALDLAGPRNLSDFRYLSFRATQVYHPVDNPDGSPLDFNLKLHSLNGEDSVAISEHGGELHFPVKALAPFGAPNGQTEQTKNAMRSYVIPLREFDIDLSAVSHVTLDFPFQSHEERELIFDDVEFYK